MKTLYLHIGLPKTATSTMQSGLGHNRKQLEQHNYLYPTYDMQQTGGAAFLLFQVVQNKRDVALLDGLIGEIASSRAANIILSTEHFSYANKLAYEMLHQLFKNIAHVKIVVYLRRPDTWLQSVWAQAVKTGVEKRNFVQFVGFNLSTNQSHGRIISYNNNLQALTNIFGQDSILVNTFEDMIVGEDDPFTHFMKVCGLDIGKYRFHTPIQETVNPSPSIKSIEVIRHCVNEIDQQISPSVLTQLLDAMDKQNWNQEKLNVVDAETHERIRTQFEQSNRAVARTYLNRDELFPTDFVEKPITTFDVNDLESVEIAKLIQRLAPDYQPTAPTLDDLVGVIRQIV